ncbi:putative mitochondrial pyruvate dehydrogenase protein X component [Lachnellula arida]|uniref:Putative mitochondrial pyruvate dehydrogenase protein X component n=1 Tax=Lachnellula arida TaxID=1316785 RepID=A0A8T9BQ37_9HELO|nr:putative mitochondrial pyruvate dehydrogenase protein X component [Lachnellula arida]
MPALSPTMTEGNIANWKLKEGDSFSAGDVLLEIETDKASMDVEAQDDGILAKITLGDGAKAIKVGTRIGVLAEPGDDINSLEIPAEESSPAPEEASKSKPEKTSESKSEAAPKSSSADSSPAKSSKPVEKQTYPLLPSVSHLIHEQGLEPADVDKMTPTGPNNRLLKGDDPKALSPRPQQHQACPTTAPKPAQESAPASPPVAEELEVAVPISMSSVIEVQQRIQKTLGIFMPLSTFIARATDVANDNLPQSKTHKPSADELFNQVLGLDKVSSVHGVRGAFLPQITALPQAAPAIKPRKPAAKSVDIIDILSGTAKPSKLASKPAPGMSASVNVFSVTVPKGDKKRAQIFLDRVKTVLEGEPGRLVL